MGYLRKKESKDRAMAAVKNTRMGVASRGRPRTYESE